MFRRLYNTYKSRREEARDRANKKVLEEQEAFARIMRRRNAAFGVMFFDNPEGSTKSLIRSKYLYKRPAPNIGIPDNDVGCIVLFVNALERLGLDDNRNP